MLRDIFRNAKKKTEDNFFRLSTLSLLFLITYLSLFILNNFFANILQFFILFFFVYFSSFYMNNQSNRDVNYKKILFNLKIIKINNLLKYFLSCLIPVLLYIIIINLYGFAIKDYITVNSNFDLNETNTIEVVVKALCLLSIIFAPVFLLFKYLYTIIILNFDFLNKEDVSYKEAFIVFWKSIRFILDNIITFLLIWLRHIPWTIISYLSLGIGALYTLPYYINTIHEAFEIRYFSIENNRK